MKSAPYRHKDTNCRLHGWVKGVMADTLTSISRRRGSALALVNPAYTSQIDSRTGLLQGTRRRDRFYCLDGVVLDADTNAACNILARLYDEEITLYMPHGEAKSLLAERTRQSMGTARPGLELRGHATEPHQPRANHPPPVPECTREWNMGFCTSPCLLTATAFTRDSAAVREPDPPSPREPAPWREMPTLQWN
ncbi:MAG: transposase [Caldilineaceae bacterium SB0661_bin_34]|nr:transposase [Caldilineaceae bacterium SB0661_bin_34]